MHSGVDGVERGALRVSEGRVQLVGDVALLVWVVLGRLSDSCGSLGGGVHGHGAV